MARGMALAGVDPSELTPPPPIKKPETWREKCSNFWYHHKPFVIVGALFVVLGIMMVHQILTNNPADYQIVVVTEEALYPQETEALKSYLSLGAEDLDGDGKIEIEIENLLPSFSSNAAPDISHSDGQKLTTYIASGERMIFVFDKHSYSGFLETISHVADEGYVFFTPLDIAATGYDPDEHYWSWAEDERLSEYGLSELPEMVFGVRTPEGTAASSQTLCEQGCALLEALTESV